jgi:H+/Cl- antiporter ClcA
LPYTLIRWSVRAGGAVLNIAVWIIFLVLLYVLPLICTLFILLQNKLLPDLASGHLFSLDVSYIALALLILVMLISTLVANLKLYLFYFEELSALQQEVKTESLKRIYDGIILVLRFYQPPNRG